MAETIGPSVRRPLLPLVTLVFGVAAFVGAAIPAVALAVVVDWWRPDPFGGSAGRGLAAVVGLIAVGLDLAWASGRRWARPVSVHRQVPRHWGHVHGPWWASLRYGLRMGFAPATILTTWTWWAGFVICVAHGWRAALLGTFVFAVTRALTMMLATAGPQAGDAMAARSVLLDQRRVLVRAVGLGAVVLACGALLGSTWWGR